MQDMTVQMIGNVVADPQIRFVPSGAAVCSFRVGVTPRFRDKESGEWKDASSMFLSVSVWRTLAEHVVASLRRGDRVFVSGRMRQRAFTTAAGEERVVFEVDADMVAPDLNRHTAELAKPPRRAVPLGAGESAGDPARAQEPVGAQAA